MSRPALVTGAGLRRVLWGAAAMSAVCAAGHAAGFGADRAPVVATRIPLESIGVTGVSANQLSAGASLLTVHFLDSNHLLVTFGTHGLVRRLENDPKEDQDRMLAAEIVEVATGKVIAKDEWQVHDHGRYLWNLGQGRFLLRTGMEFFEIEPMAHFAAGHPFSRAKIASFQRPSMILVSQDQSLITLETRVRKRPTEPQQLGDIPQENIPVTMMVEFFRMHGGGSGAEQPLSLELAGRVLTPQPLFLPLSGDGALYAEPKGRRQHWQVSFGPFGGNAVKAGELDSGCDPQLQLVSRSEYLAMICRGVNQTSVLQAYAFDGHEAWEEPLSGMDDPVFVTAPDAGRFALLRALDPVQGQDSNGVPTTVDRQELRVYQTESGDLLLRAELLPAFKSAENFDLARDGSLAVAVREKALVVYKLPAPDKRDLADMALAAKSAPPPGSGGAIRLPQVVETASATPEVGGGSPRVALSAASAAAAKATVGEQRTSPRGDVAQAANAPKRQPPTLLKPGEKPEFGKANPQPADAADDGPK